MVYGHLKFGILNDKIDSCAANKHRVEGRQETMRRGKKMYYRKKMQTLL